MIERDIFFETDDCRARSILNITNQTLILLGSYL